MAFLQTLILIHTLQIGRPKSYVRLMLNINLNQLYEEGEFAPQRKNNFEMMS